MPIPEQSRKERILSAAQAEFAAHGFAGARVGRIAAAARVNKQLLFHYFNSKTGLYQASVAEAAARVDIEPPRSGSPTERLRELVTRFSRARAALGAISADNLGDRARAAVASVIEAGQAQGHFRDDVDPGSVAEVVVAASFGFAAARNDEPPAGSQAARFAETVVRMTADHCSWR